GGGRVGGKSSLELEERRWDVEAEPGRRGPHRLVQPRANSEPVAVRLPLTRRIRSVESSATSKTIQPRRAPPGGTSPSTFGSSKPARAVSHGRCIESMTSASNVEKVRLSSVVLRTSTSTATYRWPGSGVSNSFGEVYGSCTW